jgi:hypothetical protein
MAAGQLPVVVSMPTYSLNTCSDRKPSTWNPVVSGPTKTSAQTSAVAGVRAVLATGSPPTGAAGQADVIG